MKYETIEEEEEESVVFFCPFLSIQEDRVHSCLLSSKLIYVTSTFCMYSVRFTLLQGQLVYHKR